MGEMGGRSKLDWEIPAFYTEFVLMQTKYLYTYTVCKPLMDGSACDSLVSKYIKM